MGILEKLHIRGTLCDETFLLDGQGIDACSEMLDEKLAQMEVERQNRIRIRFSFEESLLRLRDHFGEDRTFRLKAGYWLRRPYVQIEMEGEIYNPLSKTEVELEDWSSSLLTAVGISPLYSYAGGKNILRLNLARKTINSALKILIAIAVGVLAGVLLFSFLPKAGQAHLIEYFLMPLYEFWLRMLSLLSGPVIFLMACTSVLNAFTIEEEGGSSRRIVLRYFFFSLLCAVLAFLASGAFFRDTVQLSGALKSSAGFFASFLKIMPENALSPLMESNTPQLLLLALILGNSIAALGPRADRLNRIVRQGNTVGLLMAESVSGVAPVFCALIICLEILRGRLQTFSGLWQVLVLALVLSALMMLFVCLHVSARKKVPVGTLIRKLGPSFLTAIRTGSLDTGYGQMERICIDGLGMEKHFATVSLPYGMVLYMPAHVIGTILVTVFVALKFNVTITLPWILVAMVLAVILNVASPPVPGVNILTFIMLFAQLKIPSAALIDAILFDIIFGIFASAANQTLLQMDLVLQADRIGLLNKDALRSDKKKK